jgi:hypothetical protein
MGIQASIDRKKEERSRERLQDEGLDPERDMRENRNIPENLTGATATNYFLKLTPEHIAKHAKDKFSIDGRQRLSYIERINLPAYSPDSVRTLQGPEAWQKAKQLLKALYKGDSDALADMADEALKRGGIFGRRAGGTPFR